MDTPSGEKRKINEPLLSTTITKGGFRTMPFIIANEALERVASFGLMPNMIVYLMGEYGMEAITGTEILFLWSAATNFMPILGAFMADSFTGRYRMIGFGSISSFLGMVLLWSTAMIPQARPPHCYQTHNICESPTMSQLILLYCSFGLLSIGAGGIRSCSLAFGADQLDRRDNIKNAGVLETYFSWYYVSSAFSTILALTCVVYIQDKAGWKVGFGVPAMLMLFSAFSFFLASPFYIKLKTKTSLLTGFAQVLVGSFRNRHLGLSSETSNRLYHHKKGSRLVVPSEKLRFLNKACVIRNHEEDLTTDGRTLGLWNPCTVDQVEELKALIKVIPLWSTGIMMSVNVSQFSFSLLQAASMDRHITSSFEIPAGSFSTVMVISLTLWIAIYNRIILPLVSKIRGKPTQLSFKQRMGIGLFLSCTSMTVSAIVESVRRGIAIKEGISDDPHAVVYMSALWLVPQHCLNGVAEAFNAIGQNEFYYSEFPKSMSSIALTLFGLGMSAASLVSTFITSTVDDVTKRGGKESWLSSNINKGHYDYYYWLLAGLSFVNFMYFIVCSRAYGPCQGEECRVWDEEEDR